MLGVHVRVKEEAEKKVVSSSSEDLPLTNDMIVSSVMQVLLILMIMIIPIILNILTILYLLYLPYFFSARTYIFKLIQAASLRLFIDQYFFRMC